MGKNFSSIAIACTVLFALIFLNGVGGLTFVLDGGRLAVNFLLKPLEASLRWIRDLSLAFLAVRDLVTQNEYLTAQVQELNTEVARFQQAAEENRILRESLGFQASSNLDLVPAEILSRDFLNLSQTLLLNRGSRDGLKIGDNVIATGGILVGILTEVSDHTSFVELITSSGQAANARTANAKASGIIRGEHGLGLVFDQIALTETLNLNDRILTSGLGGKFLPNLFIGTVSEIKTASADLFQAATVDPAVSFRDLQFVFIAKSK